MVPEDEDCEENLGGSGEEDFQIERELIKINDFLQVRGGPSGDLK